MSGAWIGNIYTKLPQVGNRYILRMSIISASPTPVSLAATKADTKLRRMRNVQSGGKAMENYKRVLVVNRMNEYCRDAVQVGVSIARKYGSELLVLHIVSSSVSATSMAGAALNAPSAIPDEVKNYASEQERAKEELDQMIGMEIRAGLPITVLIREGTAVDEIMQVVKEEKIDLMVLLSHEEGRLEHMLFGRENDAILRRMPCSILLIKREPDAVEW